MINKIIMMIFVVISFSNAGVQEVRIGSIDSYYANSITKNELREILRDIENTFESQLGFDVFNYAVDGKPIDIVYVAPLKLEKQITSKQKKLQRKKEKLEDLKRFLPEEQKKIEEYQQSLEKFATYINEMTKSLNRYIKDANKRRDFTSTEYKNVQKYVKSKQNRIDREVKNLRKERRVLRRKLDKYNKKIFSMNNLVREHNFLSNQINRMSRSIKKVKGRAFGLKEVSLKTYYKDGQKIKEKSVKNSMTKIELYGFESKKQLKAVLAHEIAHLVGIPHINAKNALMHPILQDNQIENLSLTKSDIRNFKRNF